jgi:hypothetical protein
VFTPVASPASDPLIDDVRQFPVQTSARSLAQLRAGKMTFFVYDDTDRASAPSGG